jgi:hypothetical protein
MWSRNCLPFLVFCISLSFCPFSFRHFVCVCPSSTYWFWLPLWYLQTLLITSLIFQTTKRVYMTFVTKNCWLFQSFPSFVWILIYDSCPLYSKVEVNWYHLFCLTCTNIDLKHHFRERFLISRLRDPLLSWTDLEWNTDYMWPNVNSLRKGHSIYVPETI